MESYAIDVVQSKKNFSTQNVALSPVLGKNLESPGLKDALSNLQMNDLDDDDFSNLLTNNGAANTEEACANLPYQLIKTVRKDTSQIQLNGDNQANLNRQQLIKAKSEKFKKEYLNAMENSFESKYILDIPLGQGMHATVYKCFHINDEIKVRQLAVKEMREDDEEKILAAKKEFEITRRLDHPNIVKSIEFFVNDLRKEVHQIMEFIDGKEILDQIAEFGAYNERDALHIFKQIMEGIAYLHQNGICHRDVKPSNILVTKDQKVYIADFNVAREKTTDIFRMMTRTGTLAYSAPEIFTSTYYDEKVDIWSAGIVLYLILSGQQPFEDENVPKLISRITLGEYDLTQPIWSKISETGVDLLKRMLEISPSMRLSAKEVLAHAWLRDDFHQIIDQDLQEVTQDFLNRKSQKDQGHLSISQVINVGTIQDEILKKGLEIANLFYTKSTTQVTYERVTMSKKILNDDISQGAYLKHQTQPYITSESSSDDDDDQQEEDSKQDRKSFKYKIQRRMSKQQELLQAIEKFKAL
eukprot:403342006